MAQALEKVTIRLRLGDKEWLDSVYPNAGHNKVIRALVANHRKAVEERVASKQTPLNMEDIEE